MRRRYRLPVILVVVLIAGCAMFDMQRGVPKDKTLQNSALQALDRGDYASAVDYLDQAIAIDPDYPLYYKARGEAYRSMGMSGEAERDFKRYEHLRGPASQAGSADDRNKPVRPELAADLKSSASEPLRNDSAEEKWAAWQRRMEDEFSLLEVREREEELTGAQKAKAWEDFLTRFSDENPYTRNDNTLRLSAIEKVAAWRNVGSPQDATLPFADRNTAFSNEMRTALFIGNSAYRSIVPLRNPMNDAKAMSRALRQCGFDVETVLDADRRAMLTSVRNFHEKLKKRSGGVGLFFYAGHGIQIDGENYLVPVNATIQKKFEVDLECYKMSTLLASMESSGSALNIVILDACRNNPFGGFRSQARGLAIMDAPVGSILIYATAPGRVAEDGDGDNGMFTAMFLKHMMTANMKLEDVLKRVRLDVVRATRGQQVPWESSSLVANFYFNP
jgi:hypothetical protein